jgi:hypothetical protein
MKSPGRTIEDGGWLVRNALECGGKRSATPLSDDNARVEQRRRRCAQPAQFKAWPRYALIIPTFSFLFSAFSQSYSIDWFKIAGGGGTSTGGVYSVSGTLGQHDAGGPMTNGPYSLVGGFWALPLLVQTPGAPTLYISNAAAGLATIWWTPCTPGFTLQSTDSLSPTNWVNAPSGTNNPATVPATLPTRFYRLTHP